MDRVFPHPHHFGRPLRRPGRPQPQENNDSIAAEEEVKVDVIVNLQQQLPASYLDQTISTLCECSVENAKFLHIFNLGINMSNSREEYDIGGTSDNTVWFYYTTTSCPGDNYLLNLFVVHRQVGRLTIETVKSEQTGCKYSDIFPEENRSNTLGAVNTYQFRTTSPNQIHYIQTFKFSKEVFNTSYNYLIPISIRCHSKTILLDDFVRKIKLSHDFSELLTKKDNSDFVIKTCSGKEYDVHKIILMTHIPVFRELIQDAKTMNVNCTDEEMDLLLEFLYCGAIRDPLKCDFKKNGNISSFEVECRGEKNKVDVPDLKDYFSLVSNVSL